MDVYTYKEKSELLNKIASVEKYSTVSETEEDIVENCFCPNGIVDILSRCINHKVICSISEKGKRFLLNGGYEKEEKEKQEREKTEKITIENIKLTNRKLKYEVNTRYIAIISILVSVASLLINVYSLYGKSGTQIVNPDDSLSPNKESQTPCDTVHARSQCEVRFQCPQSEVCKDTL